MEAGVKTAVFEGCVAEGEEGGKRRLRVVRPGWARRVREFTEMGLEMLAGK